MDPLRDPSHPFRPHNYHLRDDDWSRRAADDLLRLAKIKYELDQLALMRERLDGQRTYTEAEVLEMAGLK